MKTFYPVESGKAVIEINLEYLRQLFDERDPTPFREKDLDDDAVEYIVSSAVEISTSKLGKLRIKTMQHFNPDAEAVVIAAIKEYFGYREEMVRRKIRETLNTGFKSLTIGLIFLSVAIAGSQMAGQTIDYTGYFLKEFLLLLGWVSMWKPINIFLYEWWPLLEIKNVYKKLRSIPIEVLKVEPLATDLFKKSI